MSNGQIKKLANGQLVGEILTVEHDFNFALVLREDGNDNENAPKYDIITKSRSGKDVKIGAAWVKTARETGMEFFSLTFDDASFEKPLYVTAFHDDDGETMTLVWNRSRKQAA